MALAVKEKEPRLSKEMQEIISNTHLDENRTNGGRDDIQMYKNTIMNALIENQDLLWTLHNKDLQKLICYKTDDKGDYILNENGERKEFLNGDAYKNVQIFNFLKIPDIQSTVKNFVCFDVNDDGLGRYNESIIKRNIVFRTVSHEKDVDTDWGIARHDLLAAIIKNAFDWSNICGMHIEKIQDKGRIAENGYYYREFIYEASVPNNLINKYKNSGVNLYGNKRL